MSLRSRFDLSRATIEKVGCIANDQLAGWLLCRICRPGMTFIDVGSHIGSVIAEVRHVDPSVTVIGIEPIPEDAAALRRKFPTVDIIECAICDSDGETSFYVDTVRSGYSTLAHHNGATTREIKVKMRRLDTVIAANGIDVIKIDVEGFELGVLRGAERVMAENRPTIMFESGPKEVRYTHADLWQWFADRNYVVLVPNRLAHKGDGLSLNGFLESHLHPRRTTNYFAVPAERREEIRSKAHKLLHG